VLIAKIKSLPPDKFKLIVGLTPVNFYNVLSRVQEPLKKNGVTQER